MFTAFTATLLFGQVLSEPAIDSPAFRTIDGAVVINQSPRPAFGSGVFAVWADIDVEVRGSTRQRMFLLYGGPDQFIPPLNSVCRIIFEHAPISGISSEGVLDGHSLRNRVEELDCNTGRWRTF